MATAENVKQDMPPKNGYRPIHVDRVFPKPFLSNKVLVGTYLACTGVGWYLYLLNDKQIENYQIESRSALIALSPLLEAESDREYLKQLRRNREAEEKLMQNVKGWKTGTLYGEPIYKTRDENELIAPGLNEYYAHAPEKTLLDRVYWHKYL